MQKIIGTIFTILLTAAIFLTSCGQSGKQDNPGQTEQPPETVTLDGREITKAAWWNTAWPEFGRTEEEDRIIAALNQMYDTYDFTIKFYTIAYEDYYNVITTSIASGEPMADVFWTDANQLTGVLLPNDWVVRADDTEYINMADYKWDPLVKSVSAYQDGIYGLYWGRVTPGKALFVNEDLVDTETVKNAVATGKWDWNTFIETAAQATAQQEAQPSDGTDLSDVYGLGGDYTDMLLASNGGAVIKRDSNGTERFALYDIETVQALELLRELSNRSRLLAEETSVKEDFLEGRIAFWCDSYINMKDYLPGGENAASITDVPFPKGPDAEKYVSITENVPMLVFSKGIADKEKVAFAINAYTDILWENKYKDWRDGMTENAAMLVDSGGRTFLDIDRTGGLYETFLSFKKVLMGGETAASELLEMFRLQFEAFE